MRITILGAGAFGTALAKILSDKGHGVRLYDPAKFPETTLDDAVGTAEALILAVPSQFAPDLLQQVPDKNKPLINASKGFLSLAPFSDFANFSILSGASFAENLEQKQPTVLTATSQLAQDLFQADWLKIERSSDELGILLCGTLKNIYAIGSGQRHLHSNTSDFRTYISQALEELKFILSANNCDPSTADLACGKLDLIMTSASDQSRNYQFGQTLNRRNHIDLDQITTTTEGLTAIQSLPESDLIIPAGCPILKDIIKRVEDATK